MFKLVSSLAFLAVVMGQGPLPYQVSLDPSYSFGWGVSNNTIEIQLDVSTKGWVSFGLVSDDGKMLDIWWGGYDEDYGVNYGQVTNVQLFKFMQINLKFVVSFQDGFAEYSNLTPGPRYPDTLQNLNLISINQSPFNTTTRVRFSRAFTTPDFKQDVDIPYVSSKSQLKMTTSIKLIFFYRTRDRSSCGRSRMLMPRLTRLSRAAWPN